jgi:hypothetical protein
MPLDWAEVTKRYAGGAKIPTVAGGRSFEVAGVDDEAVYVRTPLWSDALRREHLEKAVEQLDQGGLSRRAGQFVELYRIEVADVRPTSVAHVLKDLGFLE